MKSIRTVVLLIGAYIAAQAIADVAATKLVTMFSIVLPAGSIMFAFTFTLRDLIHKRLGKEWAVAAIWTAAIINVVQAAYLYWMSRMPAPLYYPYTEAWSGIFAIVPAITIGSIIAELASELTDTTVYQWWQTEMVVKRRAPQWTAVFASNAVSLPLDSFVFAMLAFVLLPGLFGGEAMSVANAWTLVAGQIVWKAVVTVFSLPSIYLVKFRQGAVQVVVGA